MYLCMIQTPDNRRPQMPDHDLVSILAAAVTVFIVVSIYALVIAEWRTPY